MFGFFSVWVFYPYTRVSPVERGLKFLSSLNIVFLLQMQWILGGGADLVHGLWYGDLCSWKEVGSWVVSNKYLLCLSICTSNLSGVRDFLWHLWTCGLLGFHVFFLWKAGLAFLRNVDFSEFLTWLVLQFRVMQNPNLPSCYRGEILGWAEEHRKRKRESAVHSSVDWRCDH